LLPYKFYGSDRAKPFKHLRTNNILSSIISSKTRLRLLKKLFSNPETRSYLRALAEEFQESTNSVRLELNRLEAANMLQSSREGNKKYFKANTEHPLYEEIHKMVLKELKEGNKYKVLKE